MNYPAVFAEVRKRPGMHLPSATFEAAASFVLGYDAAVSGGLLLGFREWLVTELNEGSNLSWPALARDLVQRRLRASASAGAPIGADEQSASVDCLFGIIEAFLEQRSRPGGARRIFAAYEQWLEAQDRYGPSSPDWIPKSR